MPWTNYSVTSTFETIESIRNTSAVVWSCGFCTRAIQIAHRFDFSPQLATGGVVEPIRCDASKIVLPWTNHSVPIYLRQYKALVTPLKLYGDVFTMQQPFKLPIGLIFRHVSTGGAVEPLRCDACRVVLP